MTKIKVYGQQRLSGSVQISGAKNAALPLFAAALLSSDGLSLKNVPPLADIGTMIELLNEIGVPTESEQESIYALKVKFKTDSVSSFAAPYDIVKRMRASILVLGPLLSRFGQCKVSLPGGCAIGVRPIDLHLKGMEALGASIELKDGYVCAVAPNGLHGGSFEFPIATVTGTENVMMAAALARGTTVLKNAAMEPEIVDLGECLNQMGAKISGHGTDTIVIDGVTSLHNTEYVIMPDRIEAGTYAIAAGITKGKVDLLGGDFRSLLPTFLESLEHTGLKFTDIENGLRVESQGEIAPLVVNTAPFPGFPTDLQAQTMALLTIANGKSDIYENIWENRFMHVAELARMGAHIETNGSHASIFRVDHLKGAPVMATDLRASFGLVLAALAAHGETIIDRVYHLDRGYCRVKEKFERCGVTIERI